MGWTEERVELLAKLWGEGLSASQIASQLGGVTRNAVIGKVHRLKLETRVKVASAADVVHLHAEAAQEAEAEEVEEAACAEVVQMQATMRSVARAGAGGMRGATALKMQEPDDEDPVEPMPEAVRPSGEVVPIARNLTLVQLTERTCKWPLGDPLSPDFRFCGNHSDDSSPYCQYHARIAFQPASERRRVR